MFCALKSCGVSYARGGAQTESFTIPTDWYKFMPTVRHTNPNLMKFADKFINLSPMNHHTSAMFCLMGHSCEFDNDNNWHVIEEFAEKIGDIPKIKP